MKKTILITGVTALIGSHFVKELLQNDNVKHMFLLYRKGEIMLVHLN